MSNSDEITAFTQIRSYESFEKYFAGAERVRAVAYCVSPKSILELFEEHEINTIEIILGKKTDFREEIKSVGVARKLERLKESGDLRIFVAPDRDLHSKLYIIEYHNGEATILNGSPNLTEAAWSNYYQINLVDEFHTRIESQRFEEALDAYRNHKKECNDEPFTESLTKELDNAESDEDAKDIIERWVAVNDCSDNNETRQVHEQITRSVADLGPQVDSDITISEDLAKYEDQTRDNLREVFRNHEAHITSTSLSTPVGEYGRVINTHYDFPKMITEPTRLRLLTPNGRFVKLSEPVPDQNTLDEALSNLKAFFETVDEYAQTDDTVAAQAHIFEGLLYFFYAPFVNRFAKKFDAGEMNGAGKSLPFLYIHGESNAGKGTFVEFAMRLISDNTVTEPIDGDRVGSKLPDTAREPQSSFPVVVDDIERKKFNSLGGLRNYWDEWDNNLFPTFVMTSNDNKPNEWFMNRSKMLHFKLMFEGTSEARLRVREIIEKENPLFKWIARRLLEHPIDVTDLQDETTPRDDLLAPVRDVVLELFNESSHEVPNYFPEKPAEWEHDVGHQRWIEAYETIILISLHATTVLSHPLIGRSKATKSIIPIYRTCLDTYEQTVAEKRSISPLLTNLNLGSVSKLGEIVVYSEESVI
ncbi:MAG: phospholipase D, partial [uncultured archaeon A07HR60]